jgi:hypothetical protein
MLYRCQSLLGSDIHSLPRALTSFWTGAVVAICNQEGLRHCRTLTAERRMRWRRSVHRDQSSSASRRTAGGFLNLGQSDDRGRDLAWPLRQPCHYGFAPIPLALASGIGRSASPALGMGFRLRVRAPHRGLRCMGNLLRIWLPGELSRAVLPISPPLLPSFSELMMLTTP